MDKEIKTKLLQMLKHRMKQKELFLELLNPLSNDIEMLNEVITNNMKIEKFMKHTNIVNEYLKNIFDKIGEIK